TIRHTRRASSLHIHCIKLCGSLSAPITGHCPRLNATMVTTVHPSVERFSDPTAQARAISKLPPTNWPAGATNTVRHAPRPANALRDSSPIQSVWLQQ
ncbi:MAG TPA: hypothetical protein VF099_19330, partial [Ktedonobacterales bacterium]